MPPPPSPPPVRSRLAPTPSGFLHLGNGASFVLTWLLTRQRGGELRLRIDDADATRVRPVYLDDIFATLAWLGLDWDQGPAGPDDFVRHYAQCHRRPAYQAALRQLAQVPGLLYACRHSRRERQVAPPPTPDWSLPLEASGCAWRAHVDNAGVTFAAYRGSLEQVHLADTVGDFVVRKKDGQAAYQLSSLVDDVHYGTNLVVRGADLRPSTAAQVWLARRLAPVQADYAHFAAATFCHHPLVVDGQGEKLSKSAGATSLRDLRQRHRTPAPFYRALAHWWGLAPPLPDTLAALYARAAELRLPHLNRVATDFEPRS